MVEVPRMRLYTLLCCYVFIGFIVSQSTFLLVLLWIAIQLNVFNKYIVEPMFFTEVEDIKPLFNVKKLYARRVELGYIGALFYE